MNVQFSPPDITEEEIQSVAEVLRSGWITTGPKTKEFERRIAEYCRTSKAVCLNSATACLEMTLRVMGIGEGDLYGYMQLYLSYRRNAGTCRYASGIVRDGSGTGGGGSDGTDKSDHLRGSCGAPVQLL